MTVYVIIHATVDDTETHHREIVFRDLCTTPPDNVTYLSIAFLNAA
jgi:hypothetical protein